MKPVHDLCKHFVFLKKECKAQIKRGTTASRPALSRAYARGIDAKRVCGEPLGADPALQLDLAELPPVLLVHRARLRVQGFRGIAGTFLQAEHGAESLTRAGGEGLCGGCQTDNLQDRGIWGEYLHHPPPRYKAVLQVNLKYFAVWGKSDDCRDHRAPKQLRSEGTPGDHPGWVPPDAGWHPGGGGGYLQLGLRSLSGSRNRKEMPLTRRRDPGGPLTPVTGPVNTR